MEMRLLFVFLFSLSTSLSAQTYSDKSFTTGFLARNQSGFFADTYPQLILEGDTIVNLSFSKSMSSSYRTGERWHYRLNPQLQVVDSFRVYQRSTTHQTSDSEELSHDVRLVEDQSNGDLYQYSVDVPNSSSLSLEIYNTNRNLSADSLIFSTTLTGIARVLPFIYDTTLVLFREPSISAQSRVLFYSLNSQQLTGQINNLPAILTYPYKALVNPQNPAEVFVFNLFAASNPILRIDWRNQRFIESYDDVNGLIDFQLAAIYRKSGESYNDIFIEDTNSIKLIGTHRPMGFTSTGQNYSNQGAVHTINTNDSIVAIRELGSPSPGSANDLSIMLYNRFNQQEVFACRNHRRGGFYMRTDSSKVTIIKIDSNAQKDSLTFYGKYDHRPVDMKMNSQGDLFIAMMMSRRDLNFEAFVVLTKIPAGVFATVKEQQLSRKIYLYPNPTKNSLRSTEFKEANRILIYTVEGKLIQEYRGGVEQLNVSHLKPGSYLIQTELEGKLNSGLFIKQ